MNAAATTALVHAIDGFINLLVDYVDTSDLNEEQLASHVDFMARYVALETGVSSAAWLEKVIAGLATRATTPTIQMALAASTRALKEALDESSSAHFKAATDDDDDDDDECRGHPAGPFDPMGQTVHCDGSCRGGR